MAEASFHRRKAEECSVAAELAVTHALWETAVSRAYYSLYHALLEVMERFNEATPRRGWNHDSLRKRFIEQFCERSFHFNRGDGDAFVDAQRARNDADYHPVQFNESRARRTVTRVAALRGKAFEVLDG
jgi:uncharacterized protein (UPF0332 family)